jgi:hypothetical protein
MSDNTLTVTEVVNSVTVTPVNNTVTVSDVGVQGPAGATGATGATGAQGSSGVVTVNAPLTNAGTSSAANLSVSTGTTSAVGVLQLTDSVSSTSTTTAATANAVKIANDNANTRLLKYATPWNINYRSGYYYEPMIGATLATATQTKNRLLFTPLFISQSITIDRIGAEVVSGGVAGTTYRLGIYSSNSNDEPSALLLDAGTIDTSTTGLKQNTVSLTLTAGLYYVCGVNQGSTGTPTMRILNSGTGNYAPVAATSMQSFYAATYIQDSVSGALPSTATPTLGATGPARIQFRAA